MDRAHEEPGELLVKGPQVFSGYWNRPQDTESVLLEGGWIRTGDIVVMDDDGFVRVVDRIKELHHHRRVQRLPVRGRGRAASDPRGRRTPPPSACPHESGGESVVAAVVAVPGELLDPEAVRAASREHLTGYKVPRQVFVLEELPRSLIGKVLHRQVRVALEEHPDRR